MQVKTKYLTSKLVTKWPVYTSEPVVIMIVYYAKRRIETIHIEVKNRSRGIKLRYYILKIQAKLLDIDNILCDTACRKSLRYLCLFCGGLVA